MKLKCTITGQIWDVDYIAASQGIRVSTFYSDYELIPDERKTPRDPHARIDYNTISIENLTSAGNIILARVMALESDNQRLKDRLNAIEGNWK
jgi:hypothetical protein